MNPETTVTCSDGHSFNKIAISCSLLTVTYALRLVALTQIPVAIQS